MRRKPKVGVGVRGFSRDFKVSSDWNKGRVHAQALSSYAKGGRTFLLAKKPANQPRVISGGTNGFHY